MEGVLCEPSIIIKSCAVIVQSGGHIVYVCVSHIVESNHDTSMNLVILMVFMTFLYIKRP